MQMINQGFTLSLLQRRLNTEQVGLAMALLSELLITTLAAQIITGPLILFHFGRLSLISLLSNLLILPVQPVIMSVGGLIACTWLFWMWVKGTPFSSPYLMVARWSSMAVLRQLTIHKLWLFLSERITALAIHPWRCWNAMPPTAYPFSARTNGARLSLSPAAGDCGWKRLAEMTH
jgi:hypothetical protein